MLIDKTVVIYYSAKISFSNNLHIDCDSIIGDKAMLDAYNDILLDWM